MFVVGLTGGIACGKTTVTLFLRQCGVHVLEADEISREALSPHGAAYAAVVAAFGRDIVQPDGQIDRKALAAIVFADPQKRHRLQRIVWPVVYRTMLKDAVRVLLSGAHYLVLDLPLLFESGAMLPFLHATIVVDCDEHLQISRAHSRDGMPEHDVRRRIAAQLPRAHKVSRATFVIDNNGSMSDLQQQVEGIVEQLNASKAHWVLRGLLLVGVVLLGLAVYVPVRHFYS